MTAAMLEFERHEYCVSIQKYAEDVRSAKIQAWQLAHDEFCKHTWHVCFEHHSNPFEMIN